VTADLDPDPDPGTNTVLAATAVCRSTAAIPSTSPSARLRLDQSA
jgi:hypothetical protein